MPEAPYITCSRCQGDGLVSSGEDCAIRGTGERHVPCPRCGGSGREPTAGALRRVALACADAAGAVLADLAGCALAVEFKSSPADLVTAADRAVEAAVAAVISRELPGHGFVGEEGTRLGLSADYVWYIDPVDGTTNFVHSRINYCVSLACYCAGEPRVGIVLDPTRQELFWAAQGEGAWLRSPAGERRLRVGPEATLEEALVLTNLYADWRVRDRISSLSRLSRESRGVRSIGAAALEMAYVAAGRVSAFAQWRLSAWDVAAGRLLVEEAGGTVTNLAGAPLRLDRPTSVLCSNGRLHPLLLEVLSGAE